jgi:hypothetical protein
LIRSGSISTVAWTCSVPGRGAAHQPDVVDAADPDAADLDGRVTPEPARGALELDEVGLPGGVVGAVGGLGVREEVELGPGLHGLGHRGGPGGVELDAADEQRLDGGELEPEAVRPGRHAHAAGVPEPGLPADQRVVGCPDEDADAQALAALLQQVVAQHLPDLDAAVVERRAARHRAQRVRAEHELAARDVRADLRRLLQPDELALLLARAGVDLDVGAGDEGAEARHPAGADPRPHDPVPGALGGEALRALPHPGGDDDPLQVVADLDPLDRADVDLAVLDPRGAGLHALGGLERDPDQRPLPGVGGPGQPARDDGRQQRDHPDQRDRARAADLRLGRLRRQARVRRHVVHR